MRATLDIDADVLESAKALAAQRGTTAGAVISELVRCALASREPERKRHGVPILPARRGGGLVTSDMVNRLRD